MPRWWIYATDSDEFEIFEGSAAQASARARERATIAADMEESWYEDVTGPRVPDEYASGVTVTRVAATAWYGPLDPGAAEESLWEWVDPSCDGIPVVVTREKPEPEPPPCEDAPDGRHAWGRPWYERRDPGDGRIEEEVGRACRACGGAWMMLDTRGDGIDTTRMVWDACALLG